MSRGPIIAALAALAALAACSVDHRSGDYTCARQQDCSGNRVCVGGWCIDPTAPDAAEGPDGRGRADASECPDQCTSCDPEARQCTIDADQLQTTSTITCPTGWTCDILCTNQNTCRDGIDCTTAVACTITCSGDSACRDIECGPGPCEIACSGDGACRDIDCTAACACDVTCTGNQSCSDGILCPGFVCDTGPGCTSSLPSCNSCAD